MYVPEKQEKEDMHMSASELDSIPAGKNDRI